MSERPGLRESARGALASAYAPYSDFRVGAALECADGSVFTGANIENSSFGLTICAERTALAAAVSAGHRAFVRIAIATETGDAVAPCGACRQVLAEFAPTLEVVSVSDDEENTWSLAELLPAPFHLGGE